MIRVGVVELIRPTAIFEETAANNFLHPSYNPNINLVQVNDIAVVKLSIDLEFGRKYNLSTPCRLKRFHILVIFTAS